MKNKTIIVIILLFLLVVCYHFFLNQEFFSSKKKTKSMSSSYEKNTIYSENQVLEHNKKLFVTKKKGKLPPPTNSDKDKNWMPYSPPKRTKPSPLVVPPDFPGIDKCTGKGWTDNSIPGEPREYSCNTNPKYPYYIGYFNANGTSYCPGQLRNKKLDNYTSICV